MLVVKLIAPDKSLGYSKIFLDYIAGLNSARHFYSGDNIESVAEQLNKIEYPRNRMADVLTRQNKAYNSSEKTFENIEKLRQKETLCLFSGQQAVLFGGPLLVILKALAIVKAANLYSKQLSRPVIPIFWIAGDDHDFEEANHTYVLNRSSEVEKISYEALPDKEWPISEVKFVDENSLINAKNNLKKALGQTDYTNEIFKLLDECYTSSDTFVTAFGKLLAKLTSDYGLILFSPGDPEVKEIARPFFRNILELQKDLHDTLNLTNEHIQDYGYHLQVEKKENAVHLFLNHDGRRPVMSNGSGFNAGDEIISKDHLLKLIDQEYQNISPDVITKPIFQSYLFPVLSQKGGPSEIAYLAQVNALFSLFGRVAPFYKARASSTIVEKHHEKTMDEYDISFEDLTGDIEQVINRVLAKSLPVELESGYKRMKSGIDETLSRFIDNSLKFDSSLEAFGEQIKGKIEFSLKQLEGKVFSAHKKKSTETRERIYRLWNALFTNRNLQERTLNVSYFISKYGIDVIRFIYDHLDSEENAHQLIYLSEMEKK